ncbi:MAG: c-type cytochrome [Planctomycetes bacterium]|nr:c-type cytochrome [Planctomycetota bacterium]
MRSALFVILFAVFAACSEKGPPAPPKTGQTPPGPAAATPVTSPAAAAPTVGSAASAPVASKPTAEPKAPEPAPRFTAAERRQARMQWVTCSTCHGDKGKGDGLAGLALKPRPRDFTDAKFQKEKTDEQLFQVIRKGGAANGLSAAMAAYDLPDGVIYALVAHIRKLGGK